MRKFFTLFVSILFLTDVASAQQDALKVNVIKPVYFDVSPPLRELSKMEIKEDRSWKEGYVKNPSNYFNDGLKASSDAHLLDPNIQRAFGLNNADTTIQSFDGVPSNNTLVPPDTDGDVGPNHYISMVNCRYSIYTKTGTKLIGPTNNSNIWSGMPNNSNDGDGIVLYDEVADRWLISQFSLPNYPNGPFFEMVAVSKTPDPTGEWYRYQYQFSYMPDYPKLSVWHDGYYMTSNRFSATTTIGLGVGVYVMDRTKMIAGNASATIQEFTLANNGPWAMLPADCDGPFPSDTTPCYFMYTKNSSPKAIIYEFKTDWINPANTSFTKVAELAVNSYNWSLGDGIPQKGTSIKLDPMSNSGRIMFRLAFRKMNGYFAMVANGTVNVGSNVAGIRWYEFRKTLGSQWSVYQQGTYAPDNNCRWMGGIAMDSAGNIAIAYSISSADMYPSIRYAGRLAGDPLNTITIQEAGIINGGGSQTNNWQLPSRWGDYSALNVDPDQTTFWYTQEYYTSTSPTNWKSRIASFSFMNMFTVNASASPEVICLGSSSQLDANATGGSGSYTYNWTSNPPGFTSTQKSPSVAPLVTTTYYCAANDGSQTKTDSIKVTVNTAPVVNAGDDETYCWWVPAFPIIGSASGYDHIKWTSAGDGHFSNDTLAVTIYYPGSGDHAFGSVVLSLTGYPLAPCTESVTDQATIIFDPCTGIQEQTEETLSFSIQPNPTTGNVIFHFTGLKNKAAHLSISDLKGQTMHQEKLSSSDTRLIRALDVSKYSSGVYIVKVESGNEVKTDRLVIQK